MALKVCNILIRKREHTRQSRDGGCRGLGLRQRSGIGTEPRTFQAQEKEENKDTRKQW